MTAFPDDVLSMQDQELLGRYGGDQVTRVVVGGVVRRRIEGNLSILVLKRVAGDEYGGLEELPSGGVEPEETIREALAREILEETGLSIEAAGLFLFDFTYPSRRGVTVQLNFLADVAGEPPVRLNPAEHESFRWLLLAALGNSGLSPNIKRELDRTLASCPGGPTS
jgi:8-oxo-dGTP diphosphatase